MSAIGAVKGYGSGWHYSIPPHNFSETGTMDFTKKKDGTGGGVDVVAGDTVQMIGHFETAGGGGANATDSVVVTVPGG